MREVPEVFVLGIVCFAVDFEGNVVCFRVFYLFVAGFYVPFTPGGDDRHFGSEMFYCKFETDLVVSFSRATVADSVGAFCFCYLNKAFCDYGAGKGCAEHIFFVKSARFDCGNDKLVYKFVCKIFYVKL